MRSESLEIAPSQVRDKLGGQCETSFASSTLPVLRAIVCTDPEHAASQHEPMAGCMNAAGADEMARLPRDRQRSLVKTYIRVADAAPEISCICARRYAISCFIPHCLYSQSFFFYCVWCFQTTATPSKKSLVYPHAIVRRRFTQYGLEICSRKLIFRVAILRPIKAGVRRSSSSRHALEKTVSTRPFTLAGRASRLRQPVTPLASRTRNEMSISLRPYSHLILVLFFLLGLLTFCHGTPIQIPPTSLERRAVSISYDDYGHIDNVTDATSHAPIAQGPATDGGGTGMDTSALIWLIFSFVVGIPLTLGGVRLWRLTTGFGVGLAVTVCLWASFANSIGPGNISDIVITIISVVAFVLGFFVGLFELGYAVGITTIALLGGFAIGVRIVLFRSNLLVHAYFGNWLIITGCGLICFVLLLVKQRAAITIGCASVGTFMTGLGIDLLINKQSGLSFGLRYLFDRNDSHVQYLFSRGWHPPISTIIILAVTLALVPPLAYAQHRVFKSPFKRVRTSSVSTLASVESAPATTTDATSTNHPPSEKNTKHTSDGSQTLELNSLQERSSPTPNPSLNSLAKLLPQKPK